MNKYTRRRFLELGCRTIIGAGLAGGGVTRAAHAQAANSDYRALVCIHLNGGNDGFNMIVPSAGAAYQEYANGRGHLAVAESDLLSLNPATANTTHVGLNPHMAALKPLFDSGQLAFQSNVGTLIEPGSAEDVRNKSIRLPAQLFSHNDQTSQWQKLNHYPSSASHSNAGWGARTSDIIAKGQPNPNLAAISLTGSNEWQAGGEFSAFNIDSEGVRSYAGMEDHSSEWQMPRREAFIRLLHAQYNNVFEKAYADLQTRALVLSTNVGAALERRGELQTPVPENNPLAQQLAMVAKLISIKDEFQLNRQLFYVSLGGFDTHDYQLEKQPALYSNIASALEFFNNALIEIGHQENVVSFTTSDFGRSVTSNGDGTDHGWGNHHIVMGSQVAGGDIYGHVPRILVDGPDDSRNGRIVPTTAVSQYAATMLKWLGLNDSEIDHLLPSLANFDQRNLGFLL